MTEIIMTEITPEVAETYLAEVADFFGGVRYIFDPDETLGGVIFLGTVPPDSDPLALAWQETDGWHAGYPAPRGGVECLTPLPLGIAPPAYVVAGAVWEIYTTGRLTAPRPVADPDAFGRERLASGRAAQWEPDPAQVPGLLRELIGRWRERTAYCAHDAYQRGQMAAWAQAADEVAEVLGRLADDQDGARTDG